jgi:hypothetical protein
MFALFEYFTKWCFNGELLLIHDTVLEASNVIHHFRPLLHMELDFVISFLVDDGWGSHSVLSAFNKTEYLGWHSIE